MKFCTFINKSSTSLILTTSTHQQASNLIGQDLMESVAVTSQGYSAVGSDSSYVYVLVNVHHKLAFWVHLVWFYEV